RVHSLRRGAAEGIEVIARGNSKTSKVIGRSLAEIELPPGTIIGAVIRNEQTWIANNRQLIIEPEDHLILFVVNKSYIHDVERLFQVNESFF
ncbi:MAG: Trk system potassium transporter TrkA, partial [Proteobacteria bacterium]|nr:Trk system potassium transporter TrkA [Pseudomonadota bacterium]